MDFKGQPTFAYNPTCGSQHPSFKRFALPAGCTCALMRHILRSRNPARQMGAKSAPLQQAFSVCEVEAPAHSTASTEPPRSLEEEARDILATAAKNQTEDGPSTRRAAIRAFKYLRAMVNQHGSLIQSAHEAAKIHTQRSKGSAATAINIEPCNIARRKGSSQ